MEKIEIDLKKSLGKNISNIYSKIKKLRAKIESATKVVESSKKQLKEESEKIIKINEQAKIKEEKKEKREWYEKFRWFITSSKKFVIGGRDATTNDIIVKKHTEPKDIIFHTDVPGSPFAIVKDGKDNLNEKDIEEVADFVVTYSKAWKQGVSTLEVFYVPPESVTKKAKSGEYLKKGSFMVYGKKSFVTGKINLSIGITNKNKLMAGPKSAIEAHCKEFISLIPGKRKTTDIAKQISKKIKYPYLDEIIRAIPSGGCEIKKK